jgi:hypothetical protein
VRRVGLAEEPLRAGVDVVRRGAAVDPVEAGAPASKLSTWRPAAAPAFTNGRWPPEKANRPCSGAAIAGSIGRTDRTGPISGGSAEW